MSRSKSMPSEVQLDAVDDIVKPINDERQYRLITLPNQMRCLLISDPTITAPRLRKRTGCGSCFGSAAMDVDDGGAEERRGFVQCSDCGVRSVRGRGLSYRPDIFAGMRPFC